MYSLFLSSVATHNVIDSIHVEQIRDEIEALRNFVNTSNGAICNEIASADLNLTVITLLIGAITIALPIIGFFIGRYINSLNEKLQKIERTVIEKEKTIIRLSETVHETEERINNNIGDIYKKLRKEELKANVKRLVIEPLDIRHYISSLLSNDLDNSLFEDLYQAYKKLVSSGKAESGASFMETSYKDNYLIAFFQHFLCQSILTADLRNDIITFFNAGCKCAFERDIIKCTEDICKALNEPIISSYSTDILYNYLIAVNDSEFKSLKKIKEIINSDIQDKSIIRQAIDRCTSSNVYLELFDNKQPIDDEQ